VAPSVELMMQLWAIWHKQLGLQRYVTIRNICDYMSAPHIILDNLPSLCQKLSDLVEVWRSYNKNNFACFFETRCTIYNTRDQHLSAVFACAIQTTGYRTLAVLLRQETHALARKPRGLMLHMIGFSVLCSTTRPVCGTCVDCVPIQNSSTDCLQI